MTDYRLIRSARRTLALEIDENGEVIVRAPLRLSEKKINAFVAEHEGWIEKKRAARAARKIPALIASLSTDEIAAAKRRAREILLPKLDAYAAKMGVTYTQMKITSAKTRFGSCTTDGTICFSYRLIFYPDAAIDYVVVHELAHRRYMNHGRAFYALIEKTFPAWREAVTMLKTM